MQGWIKIHRRLTEWEWYDDSRMVHLFLHLLINANHEPKTWKGIDINRGQLVTGRLALSAQTGISEKAIRLCLDKLKSTNDVAIKTTNKYSLITIINYDNYQDRENKGQQKDQPEDQQGASERATPKEEKKKKEEKTYSDVEELSSLFIGDTTEYDKFNKYILGDNLLKQPMTSVMKMPPLEVDQFYSILKLSREKDRSLFNMLDSMHNKPKLIAGNKSLYLTLNSWLNRK